MKTLEHIIMTLIVILCVCYLFAVFQEKPPKSPQPASCYIVASLDTYAVKCPGEKKQRVCRHNADDKLFCKVEPLTE
jgi:hypothetical protein